MASFQNNGKLKLLIIVGTRPEIIRLAAVITRCRRYFDTILAHTGQELRLQPQRRVFFHDLELADPEVYMDAVGDTLGQTMGNIIAKSYDLMVALKPDAVLVLGDTNSCLSVIGAKRLHIPIFHMEAGQPLQRRMPAGGDQPPHRGYHLGREPMLFRARAALSGGLRPAQRAHLCDWQPHGRGAARQLRPRSRPATFTRGWGSKRAGTSCSLPIVKRTSTRRRTSPACSRAINRMAEKYDMPILYSCHPRSRKRLEQNGFQLDPRVIQHEPLGLPRLQLPADERLLRGQR